MPKKSMVTGGPARCLSSTVLSSMLPHRGGHPPLGKPSIKLFYQCKMKCNPYNAVLDGARFGSTWTGGISTRLPDPDLSTWYTTLTTAGRHNIGLKNGLPEPERHSVSENGTVDPRDTELLPEGSASKKARFTAQDSPETVATVNAIRKIPIGTQVPQACPAPNGCLQLSSGYDASPERAASEVDPCPYGSDLYEEDEGGYDDDDAGDRLDSLREAYLATHPDYDGEPSAAVDRSPGERWNIWIHAGDRLWSHHQATRLSSGVAFGCAVTPFAQYDTGLRDGLISESPQLVHRPLKNGNVVTVSSRGGDDDGGGPPPRDESDRDRRDGEGDGGHDRDEFPLDESSDIYSGFAGKGNETPQDNCSACRDEAATSLDGHQPPVAVEIIVAAHTKPYAGRVVGSHRKANDPDTLPDQASWALYDMTELLGGKRRKETFSTAEQYKNSEFREVVNFFAPIVRTVTGEDYFYHRRYAKLIPANWSGTGQKYPPSYPQRGFMGRYGVRYKCDFARVSGCEAWVEIAREQAMDPSRPLYSLRLSNGLHRHACNHFHARHQERSDPNCVVPSLHPAVDHFIRVQVRKAVGSDPVTYAKLGPKVKEYLRVTRFVHCGLPHPEGAESPGARNEDSKCTKCWHHATYHSVASAATPYLAEAARMPPRIETVTCKRVGKGKRKARSVYTTQPDAVTINHMMLRQGDAPNGRGLFDTDVEEQIKLRLEMYNTEFGWHDSPVRLEGNSMEDFWAGFERDNLYKAWTSFVESTNPAKHFDIYQWRLVGLLYRKKASSENSTPRMGTDVPVLSVDDFAEVAAQRSCGADNGYEMIAVLGSLASLAVSWKAWSCRKETGGVVLGLDHMYNFLKATSNVCSSTHTPVSRRGAMANLVSTIFHSQCLPLLPLPAFP